MNYIKYPLFFSHDTVPVSLQAAIGVVTQFPESQYIIIPLSIWILLQNPDLTYHFITVLTMSLNFIQSWPEFNLSYPQNFNFIHLSLLKINFILLFRNCIGTPNYTCFSAYTKNISIHALWMASDSNVLKIFEWWYLMNLKVIEGL